MDRSSAPADPPPGCAVAEAWTRQDTHFHVATTLGATVRAKESGFKVVGVFFALLSVVIVVAALGGPQEVFQGIVCLGGALIAVWLVSATAAGGGTHDTSEPVSWREARASMEAAMGAPLWSGERDLSGARVRVRGRVRARTVIDGPEGGWCVASERHTPDSETIDTRTIERAGGVFDVVTDEGLTVQVDARHVAVVDGRATPQHAALHRDTWTAVIPDGAYVDVVGAMREELVEGSGYRGEKRMVMSGTEAEPVGVMWRDGGGTGVRVDARVATTEDAVEDAAEQTAGGGSASRRA